MTAKSALKRILPAGRKLRCAKCPIPQRTCKSLSTALYGEEKCLLRIVLREILIFRADRVDKGKK